MRAIVLTADGFEDSELLYPFYRFQEEGMEVDIAATKAEEIHGKHGQAFRANLTFAYVDPDEYDLLLIPGGLAPEKVRLDTWALEVARKMIQSGKLVAAICHGPQVLASAGLLRGRRLTCWPGIRDDMVAAGAEYVDNEVIVDGNLITSRMPQDLPAFCREVIKAVRQPQVSSAFWESK